MFVSEAGVLHSDNHQSSVIALAPIMASSSGFVFAFARVNQPLNAMLFMNVCPNKYLPRLR